MHTPCLPRRAIPAGPLAGPWGEGHHQSEEAGADLLVPGHRVAGYESPAGGRTGVPVTRVIFMHPSR